MFYIEHYQLHTDTAPTAALVSHSDSERNSGNGGDSGRGCGSGRGSGSEICGENDKGSW